MTIARWIETDSLSNQNISSALAIGAYTADADRVIMVDVSIDQVAGNGDYVIYLTRQINGAGSAYVILPKTTCAAASGETAIAMQSGAVTVRSGDVVTCYVDGLAGDTTTPDTTVRWFEMSAASVQLAATQGAVTFTGQVKISANVANQGALHLQNAHGLGSGIYADGGMNGQYNSGANGSGVLNTGASAGIYNYGSIGLLNEGQTGQKNLGAINNSLGTLDPTTAATVWAYDLRTLTSTALATAATYDAGTLSIARTTTVSATVSGLTISASWTSIYLTIKRTAGHTDANAVLQLVVSNPAAAGTDGVSVLNAATAGASRTLGSLVVNQAGGTVTLALQDDLTALLPERLGLEWDIKQLVSGSSSVLGSGTANITTAVTRAI